MSTSPTSRPTPPEFERFRNNPALIAAFNRPVNAWGATFAHRLAKYSLAAGGRPGRLYVGDREWAWFENATDASHRVHDPKGLKGAHVEYQGVRIIRCLLKKHWHFTA